MKMREASVIVAIGMFLIGMIFGVSNNDSIVQKDEYKTIKSLKSE